MKTGRKRATQWSKVIHRHPVVPPREPLINSDHEGGRARSNVGDARGWARRRTGSPIPCPLKLDIVINKVDRAVAESEEPATGVRAGKTFRA